MYRVLNVMLAMLLGAATARASPWWVVWSGDSYPESEGWNRFYSDPPPERWLEDGKLFLDSRAASGMWEVYSQLRPGEMTLGPGEALSVHWRIRVDDVPGGYTDPGVTARSDDQWTVRFSLGIDSVHSDYEPGNWAPFEPGVFHDFSFESLDMRTYTLSIDGVPSLQGNLFESLFYGPGVGWGDGSTGQSLSEWDLFEGGIVPEPDALLCMLAGFCVYGLLWRSAAR